MTQPLDILKQRSLNNGQVLYLCIGLASVFTSGALIYYTVNNVQEDSKLHSKQLKVLEDTIKDNKAFFMKSINGLKESLNGRMDRKGENIMDQVKLMINKEKN
jgi:hypothetical protein